jgi:hypothetical protein
MILFALLRWGHFVYLEILIFWFRAIFTLRRWQREKSGVSSEAKGAQIDSIQG